MANWITTGSGFVCSACLLWPDLCPCKKARPTKAEFTGHIERITIRCGKKRA